MRNVRRLAVIVTLSLIPRTAAATTISPRIVNGNETSAYPAVGALLVQDSTDPTQLDGLCSGTLIGCSTFLTAAHCVCPEDTDSATGCMREGVTDPSTLRVLLPNGGILSVASISVDPAYNFTVSGDVAALHLATPAAGMAPVAINLQSRIPTGTPGTIVGFGSTGGPSFLPSDYGVKRDGKVTTADCPDDISSAAHVCWNYDGTQSSTCEGDSGGALFVDLGSGLVLAGVTSGDESNDCSAPDQVFDTDVFVASTWIQSQLEGDTGAPCGELPTMGDYGASAQYDSRSLSSSDTQLTFDFNVPPATDSLRILLNGQEYGGSGFQRVACNYDLFVRSASTPADTFDCTDTRPGAYGDCELSLPRAGAWQAVVKLIQGEGDVQLSVTTFADKIAGDMNCDGHVSAADLVALATLIGNGAASPCPHADANSDGVINADDAPAIVGQIFTW